STCERTCSRLPTRTTGRCGSEFRWTLIRAMMRNHETHRPGFRHHCARAARLPAGAQHRRGSRRDRPFPQCRGSIGASLQTLLGGNITLYTELCERARADAYSLMVEHAAERGANAIIGMRYDANEIMAGVTEVLAYGTAVIVEPAH